MFSGLGLVPAVWQGAAMQGRSTRAGGCFLTLCIFAGLAIGIARHNPMQGVLAGTVVGVLVAVVLWLVDRGRR
jgi:hypothetical protein